MTSSDHDLLPASSLTLLVRSWLLSLQMTIMWPRDTMIIVNACKCWLHNEVPCCIYLFSFRPWSGKQWWGKNSKGDLNIFKDKYSHKTAIFSQYSLCTITNKGNKTKRRLKRNQYLNFHSCICFKPSSNLESTIMQKNNQWMENEGPSENHPAFYYPK